MLTGGQRSTIVVNCVFPAFAVIATGLRLYARKLKNIPLEADDYTILVSLIFMFGISMPYIYAATKNGISVNFEDFIPIEAATFSKITFWTQFPYILAVSLIKISILLLYGKVFATNKFKMVVKFMEGLIIIWTISFFFASLFQADPIDLNWDPSWEGGPEITGHVVNVGALFLTLACTELALDVMTLALPWVVVWRLQMKTRRKWIVSGMFMLGGLTCIASAIRIYYFHFTLTASKSTALAQYFIYQSYDILIWTCIEPSLGIVCASLPVLGPIFTTDPPRRSISGFVRSHIRMRTNSNRKISNSHQYQTSATGSLFSEATENVLHVPDDETVILTTLPARRFDDKGRDLQSQD